MVPFSTFIFFTEIDRIKTGEIINMEQEIGKELLKIILFGSFIFPILYFIIIMIMMIIEEMKKKLPYKCLLENTGPYIFVIWILLLIFGFMVFGIVDKIMVLTG